MRAPFRPRVRLAAERLEDRATPATLTVTTLNDAGPGSLRDAITQANDEINHPGADTIVFDPALGNQTISLTTFSNPPVSTAVVPQPAGPSALTITTAVTIQGSGQTITRATGAPAAVFRFFQVTADGNLTLENLTLSQGSALGYGDGSGGGGSAGLGGAIYNQGTLAVTDCTLTGNLAEGGSTISGGGSGAGAGLGGRGKGTAGRPTAASAWAAGAASGAGAHPAHPARP
jgi:hypothetical protein